MGGQTADKQTGRQTDKPRGTEREKGRHGRRDRRTDEGREGGRERGRGGMACHINNMLLFRGSCDKQRAYIEIVPKRRKRGK